MGKVLKKEKASFRTEKDLWKKGYRCVVSLDEAGRGPLAGPVAAAAVMINHNDKFLIQKQFKNLKINDSKKLSAKQREEAYKAITKSPFIKWGIGKVSERIIDKINIQNAAELAMFRALKNLKLKPDFLIIDGNRVKNPQLKNYNLKLMVKADEKVFSCACASILAKVARDRLMISYHKKYPKYKFDLHKGYPTKEHIRMLKKYKPCKIHRISFGPVSESLKRKARS